MADAGIADWLVAGRQYSKNEGKQVDSRMAAGR